MVLPKLGSTLQNGQVFDHEYIANHSLNANIKFLLNKYPDGNLPASLSVTPGDRLVYNHRIMELRVSNAAASLIALAVTETKE